MSEQGEMKEPQGGKHPYDRAVGQGEHIVKPGDCINSIAYEAGFAPNTIWNDAKNADLKSARKNMDVLLPGDKVHIPELREKQESGSTEAKHSFRKKGTPAKLQLRFTDFGKARANEEYIIEVDGRSERGVTNGEGAIKVSVPPNAKKAVVLLGASQDRFEFNIGHVDPIESVSGAQARLNNLHYYCGENNGELNAQTKRAIRQFQADQGLPETGELDNATQEKLKDVHGC